LWLVGVGLVRAGAAVRCLWLVPVCMHAWRCDSMCAGSGPPFLLAFGGFVGVKRQHVLFKKGRTLGKAPSCSRHVQNGDCQRTTGACHINRHVLQCAPQEITRTQHHGASQLGLRSGSQQGPCQAYLMYTGIPPQAPPDGQLPRQSQAVTVITVRHQNRAAHSLDSHLPKDTLTQDRQKPRKKGTEICLQNTEPRLSDK
jgi:hypothetical protein